MLKTALWPPVSHAGQNKPCPLAARVMCGPLRPSLEEKATDLRVFIKYPPSQPPPVAPGDHVSEGQ